MKVCVLFQFLQTRIFKRYQAILSNAGDVGLYVNNDLVLSKRDDLTKFVINGHFALT